MKFFIKNGGIWMVLAGALCLIVPFFMHCQTNTSLLIGWLLVVTGFIAYIIINKLMS